MGLPCIDRHQILRRVSL
ncbi:hypothetical protein CP061683_1066A, partial [Chlamydia psittaci 06-1683]